MWKVVQYTQRHLSSSTTSRANLSKTIQPSPKQEFEVDFQPSSETNSDIGIFKCNNKNILISNVFYRFSLTGQ